MPSTPASADISSGVSKLSLTTPSTKTTTKSKSKKPEVADSWEDEDVSSGSDTETETEWPTQQGHPQGTAAPPPTPISPATYDSSSVPYTAAGPHGATLNVPGTSTARPEKTDAVARRMIAGALGLKAPKMTEEQRAYQKAIQEKERKRREEQKAIEKQKEADANKAKAAIWDD
ncbi:hypothetical protein BD289DRAFT_422697 [Coniella lustricola]|uniref:Uncharacterized protein n=1 Tax=Coniella lustricola TaxID=2025994 RepID=A0A2T3AKE7_9PEZI|nr:hypothetical protein BD289DRAFT_422697 [Coniella lustricola]